MAVSIRKGVVSQMSNKINTMGEIARLSGVSISTVSRVLNNAPGISDDTRGRVLEIASSHNFIPQKRKRHINRSIITLTIVVPDAQQIETNPFFNMGELINSINNAFQHERKQIETLTFSELGKWIERNGTHTDGVIFAFGDITAGVKEYIREKEIPHIFLNRTLEGENYISCNNFKGMLRLGKYLFSRGYNRIGYLGCSTIPVNEDRLRGYYTAILEKGKINDKLVYIVESIEDINTEVARFFINNECDAIMVFNDSFAIRLITALSEIGKKVPHDIAITGFDNSPMRKLFKPSITTISLSTYEMGFLAGRWLRDNIQHRQARTLRLEVNGSLVEGDSVMTKRKDNDKEQG